MKTRDGVDAPAPVGTLSAQPSVDTLDLDEATNAVDDLYARFQAAQQQVGRAPSTAELDETIYRESLRHNISPEDVAAMADDVRGTLPAGASNAAVVQALQQRVTQQALVNAANPAEVAPRGAQQDSYPRDEHGRISEVYYASYGSNLYAERFMVYINGGSLPGNQLVYSGTADPTPPRDDVSIALPGAQFFAGESRAWSGGVAFLDTTQTSSRSLGRAYHISGEQFADVVAQENGGSAGDSDIDITTVVDSPSGQLDTGGVYGTLVHVGDYNGRPVVTFTSPFTASEAARDGITVTPEGTVASQTERKASEPQRRAAHAATQATLPKDQRTDFEEDWDVFLNTPSQAYVDRIAGGIQESHSLNAHDAHGYVNATTR